eukprot:GFUD01029129.1.p1 GENE.GFUD01029129.1~~GFUD01029129.1.p1  ORF type:complete len:108 (-),score=10.74 GFUD01029129.1:635-958(-)
MWAVLTVFSSRFFQKVPVCNTWLYNLNFSTIFLFPDVSSDSSKLQQVSSPTFKTPILGEPSWFCVLNNLYNLAAVSHHSGFYEAQNGKVFNFIKLSLIYLVGSPLLE